MIDDDVHKLLDRYLVGNCSREEKELVETFYNNSLKTGPSLGEWSEQEKETARQTMFRSIVAQKGNGKKAGKSKFSWKISKVAASILLLLSCITWFYIEQPIKQVPAYITKNTGSHQKSTVTLSDGSSVRLNTNSTLTYPSEFKGDYREVKLAGEAFFNIVKDADRPFIVTTGEVKTVVLGTSFNIKAKSNDENVAVTVSTGKVKVESNTLFSEPKVELLPGQQAIFNRSNKEVVKSHVDIQPFLTWMEEVFLFDHTPLSEVISQLEYAYDLDILLKNDALKNCSVSGKFKNEGIVDILEGLRFMNNITYQFHGDKTIIIEGEPCKPNAYVE